MSRTLPFRHMSAGILAALLFGCSGHAPPATAPAASYAAVARGRVDVEGGLVEMSVSREGVVARVAVREGQIVHKGEVLLELDATTARLNLQAADNELRQARAQENVLAGQYTAAVQRADRLLAAAKAGAGEGQLADDAKSAAAQLAAQREVVQTSIAGASVKQAAARYELQQRTLRSPQDGQLVHVAVQTGMSVSPQTPSLLTLLPELPHIVRAELNESYVGQIQAGATALISAEDDADRSWPATVERVSAVVAPSQLEEDPQRRAAARTIECVLSLEPTATLRVGQRVLVRFGKAKGKDDAKG
jgi:multidrug efflux pump subunit AcrA (membrane-fusion protein)